MAIYYLNMKTFGRGGGSSAVNAAAYRSGERIRDERTGRTYDHSARQDVMHKEIVCTTAEATVVLMTLGDFHSHLLAKARLSLSGPGFGRVATPKKPPAPVSEDADESRSGGWLGSQ